MRPERRLLLVGIVVGVGSLVAMHASCSGSTDAPADVTGADSGGASADVIADAVVEQPDGGSLNDTTAADAAPDGAWFDGEYCPSTLFPPRGDGCPCRMGFDPTGPTRCTAGKIGLICEYFQLCPPGPTERFVCKWYALPDGGRFPDYGRLPPGNCPTNDAG